MWRESVIALMLLLTGLPVSADDYNFPAERRVGRTYWARPGVNDTSVDFFKDSELRNRLPVYRKTRFKIRELVALDTFPEATILYKVRLDSGDEGYIGLAQFEEGLYAELRKNQVMSSDFTPPLGVGLHVYIFERKNIFTTDPDVIWNRIKNDGPHFFRRLPPDDEHFFGRPPKSQP